jgi:hypothetical protein
MQPESARGNDGNAPPDSGLVRPALSGAVLAIAAAKLLLHLAAIRNYGIFRDELYYVACGRHLDWGYVDQPPLVGLVARVMDSLFPGSLVALRLPAVLAGVALVLLAGLIARDLGGRAFAQSLAALAVLASGVYLYQGHVLTMNAFEPLFWMGCAWLLVRMVNTGNQKLWLWFGLLAGIGLQNKNSTLVFGLGVTIGLLLTPLRAHLRSRWIWLGGLIAGAIYLPNFWWQAAHGFPQAQMLAQARAVKDVLNSPVQMLLAQVQMLNPATLPVWLAGLYWFLVTAAGRRYRVLGFTYLAVFAVFAAFQSKAYYVLPAYPMLFAGGGVFFERAASRRRWGWLKPALVAVLLASLVFAPLALPILPVETFIRYSRLINLGEMASERHKMGPLPQQYADMFGWEEMARKVAEVYNRLPADERSKAGIFGQNYGQAGAIDYFGPRYGLPPAISGHNQYWLWGPRGYGQVLIVIGGNRADCEKVYESVEPAGQFSNRYVMPYENDLTIWILRKPKVPLGEVWPRLRHYE